MLPQINHGLKYGCLSKLKKRGRIGSSNAKGR
jgi:hypothetical protein